MRSLTSVSLIFLAAGTVLAQTANPVVLNLTMFAVKTVTVGGKVMEQLSANPGTVLPGDVLSQVVTVRNTASKTLTTLPVTLPVPKNTVYMSPEAGLSDARTEYSIDGGKTFASAPLKKTVTVMENGRSVTRDVEVKPSEYTAVRWFIAELGASRAVTLGYRIQVK